MDSNQDKPEGQEEPKTVDAEANGTDSNSSCRSADKSSTSCSTGSCSAMNLNCVKEMCNLSNLDFKWLAERIQLVMLDPKECWGKIKEENLEPKQIYSKYLFPLALLAAVCSFIGASVIGISTGLTTIRVPFFSGLIFQFATFVVSLLGYAVMALIVEKLAPKFEAQVSFQKALLLVGFSATPGLLAGLFSLFPSGLFALVAVILSIYSLYLLWTGFDRIIDMVPDKKVAFFATSIVCSILAMVFLQLISTSLFGPAFPSELSDQRQFEESLKQLVPESK